MNTNYLSISTLLALAGKGASISISASDFTVTAIISISAAVRVHSGRLTIRNASVLSPTALMSIADRHVNFEF